MGNKTSGQETLPIRSKEEEAFRALADRVRLGMEIIQELCDSASRLAKPDYDEGRNYLNVESSPGPSPDAKELLEKTQQIYYVTSQDLAELNNLKLHNLPALKAKKNELSLRHKIISNQVIRLQRRGSFCGREEQVQLQENYDVLVSQEPRAETSTNK